MLCTYCGQTTHTAARCRTRPRSRPALAALAAAITAALVASACSKQVDVPPARLADPPADLMVAPPDPPDIPACEGEKACRTRYYARARQERAELAGRLTGLQRWVRVGRGK